MLHITREWIKAKLKLFWDSVLNQRTHPHDIAFAYGLGIFISALPVVDFFLAFIILFFFRINKVALIAGMATINPLVTPFVYAFSFKVGSSIVGYSVPATFSFTSISDLLGVSFPFFLGNLVVSFSLALFGYIVVYTFCYFFVYMRHKREDKKLAEEFAKFEEKVKSKILFKKKVSLKKSNDAQIDKES